MKFLDSLNLQQNELQNAVVQNLGTAPSSPRPGQVFYNTTGGITSLQFWNNGSWITLDAAKLSNYIPLAALTNITAGSLIGNNTGSSGSPTALTAAQAKTLLSISSGDVSGLSASITSHRLNEFAIPLANVALNSQNITGMADPVSAQDAATKGYVDNQVQQAASGIDCKNAVQVATTANITLSGLQTIDGYTTLSGDRVLVKNQTAASGNGLYIAGSGAWARSADGVQGELTSGALVLVLNGSTQAGTQWYLQTVDPITVGTTSLTFTQFGAGGTYTADASGGLQLSGSAFSVKLPASSGLVKDATGLYVDNSVYPKKYSATIGDGASTTINVTHNLGTQDVIVQVRAVASPYDVQLATVQCTNTTVATLIFSTAPASSSLRVNIMG